MALQNNRQLKVSQLEIHKSENASAALRTYRLPQFKVNMMEGQLLTKVNFTLPDGPFRQSAGAGTVPAGSGNHHNRKDGRSRLYLRRRISRFRSCSGSISGSMRKS